MPTATRLQYIDIDEFGRAWITGANTKVIEVVMDQYAYGWSPEEIHFQHPHLSMAEIHAALSYFHGHRAEIEAEIDAVQKHYHESKATGRPFSICKTHQKRRPSGVSLPLYMDVHVPRAVTLALRLRSVDVLTAQEDKHAEVDDPVLLARATSLGRILVTQDQDLLAISADWQRREQQFTGLVYAPQTAISIGDFIRDLELIATLGRPLEFENRVEYLPY